MWHFKTSTATKMPLVMILLGVVLSSLSSASPITEIYDSFSGGGVDGSLWTSSAFTDPYRKAEVTTVNDFFSNSIRYCYLNYQMVELAGGRFRVRVGGVSVYTSTTNGETGYLEFLWEPSTQMMEVKKNGVHDSDVDLSGRTSLKLDLNQSADYNAAPPDSAVTVAGGVLKLTTNDAGLGDSYTYIDNVTYSYSLKYNSTYNTNTLSSNTEAFAVNITINRTDYTNVNGYINYNNTIYAGIRSGAGGSWMFAKSLTVPSVKANTNISLYWTFELTNLTSSIEYFNTTVQNQTIGVLSIDDCSVYTVVMLNYTLRDERTQAVINATIFNASIELDMQLYSSDLSNLVLNLSKLYVNSSNARVCLESSITNSSYKLFSKARYYGDSYVTRYNYIQNFVVLKTTSTQNINLFDLQSAHATKFLMTYKDSSFLAVSDALISINKFYTSEGISKTVEVEKTDYLGQATGYFDLTGVTYSIVVSKDGAILSNFNNIAVFCQDIITQNCILNLDESSILSNVINFQTYNNLNYQQSFNSTSRIYTLNFNTIDNSISLVSINMSLWNMYANTTICSNQVSTSSGSLSCSVPPSYNNVSISVDVYKDGTLIDSSIYTIAAKAIDKLGGSTIIFLLGIIMTIGVMFIPSGIGLVVATIIGLIFSIVLFSLSSSILGGAFMFIVVVAVIIIWRIRQGGTE